MVLLHVVVLLHVGLLLMLRSGKSLGLALWQIERLADGTDVRSVDGSSQWHLVVVHVFIVEEDVDELFRRVAASGKVALADVGASVGRRSQEGGAVVDFATCSDFIGFQGRHWVTELTNRNALIVT